MKSPINWWGHSQAPGAHYHLYTQATLFRSDWLVLISFHSHMYSQLLRRLPTAYQAFSMKIWAVKTDQISAFKNLYSSGVKRRYTEIIKIQWNNIKWQQGCGGKQRKAYYREWWGGRVVSEIIKDILGCFLTLYNVSKFCQCTLSMLRYSNKQGLPWPDQWTNTHTHTPTFTLYSALLSPFQR